MTNIIKTDITQHDIIIGNINFNIFNALPFISLSKKYITGKKFNILAKRYNFENIIILKLTPIMNAVHWMKAPKKPNLIKISVRPFAMKTEPVVLRTA